MLPSTGWNVETAFHRDVEHRAAGERADPHDFAPSHADAAHALHAPAALRAEFGQNFDRRRRADKCEPHIVGVHHEGRTDIGDFDRPDAWRIADQRVGGAQTDRVERTADRNTQCAGGRAGPGPAPS